MNRSGEKRKAARVNFPQPIDANLANMPVRLVDISTSGARVEHDFPLTNGKRLQLNFRCDGESISVLADVVRCRLEQSARSFARKMGYTSGLRFVEPDQSVSAVLWGLIGMLSIDNLTPEREKATDLADFAIVS